MPVIDPYTGAATVGGVWVEEQKIAEEEVKRAEGRFRSVAGARRSHLAWRGAAYYPAELLASQARAADLVILGREPSGSSPRHAANPGDVLMAAGRPVLVSPSNCALKPMLAHILIAWKDSRQFSPRRC